jgi:hypothetical protein
LHRCQAPFSLAESSFILGPVGSKDDSHDIRVIFKPLSPGNYETDLFLEMSPWNFDRIQSTRVTFEPTEKQYKTIRVIGSLLDKQLAVLNQFDEPLKEVNFRNILMEIGTESVPVKISNLGPFFVPWVFAMVKAVILHEF